MNNNYYNDKWYWWIALPEVILCMTVQVWLIVPKNKKEKDQQMPGIGKVSWCRVMLKETPIDWDNEIIKILHKA